MRIVIATAGSTGDVAPYTGVGAGTTAAGLRAGIPAIAVPVMLDELFWAKRLYELGVAPVPIPATELSAERLAAAFTAVTTEPSYRARAAELAGLIAMEDGNGAVADAVEALVP